MSDIKRYWGSHSGVEPDDDGEYVLYDDHVAALEAQKELLRKYVKYLKDAEGTDFIDLYDFRIYSDVEFTDEEWAQLEEISKLT